VTVGGFPEATLRAGEKARARLEEAERIVLTTHVRPDGDGLGSQAALARWLRARGKQVEIVNPHPIPRRFRFLDTDPPIRAFEPAGSRRILEAADLLVVMDISVPERLGGLEPLVEEIAPPVVIIDHHAGASKIDGIDVRDAGAAATGELVYGLFEAWDAVDEITPPIADALYAAIAYDTGGFRYANTTGRTHEVAAELIRHGAAVERINRLVFESVSPARARLTARVMTTFSLSRTGRVAWAALPLSWIEEEGADPDEIDGIVEALRAIEGVDVAILFKELDEEAVKISFRSAGDADVNAFADKFGGGGHKNASGAFVRRSLGETMDQVVGAALRAFERDGSSPRAPRPAGETR